MNKKILSGVVAAFAAAGSLLTTGAEARTASNATITSIVVGYYASSVVAVKLNSAMSNLTCSPGVSTGFQQTFLFDPGQQSGRNSLSVLTAAFLAGKKVTFIGTGACASIFLRGAATETKYAEELGHFEVVN